ncbi:flagellar hook-associated protein FlgL [Microbacterium sp. STN6]|uniref:flagellar hook-associated protein FlgL n=1 Tax=Microbacterium sp. STN6 TaxID=2995588 RepID=UPI002260BA80|nr:flagellar hook-associated protein FlgL [Microbacterium sp. STN6]MCX7522368.1 flagellar hook-associated protein FlgL [Microbacterium sp. STN6]
MITRVTNQMLMSSAHRNLQANMVALAKLQEQASSHKQIQLPSDDPLGTAASLSIHSQQSANAQYGRNIGDADSWLTMVDSTISAGTTVMHRVRDLVVRGSNDGSMSQSAKNDIATELDSLKSELLGQANTSLQGRNIFAGNSTAGAAFAPDYTYTGASGSTVQRRIDASTTVRVDADGSAVYGDGDASVFALIDKITTDLRAGTNVSGYLTQIDDRMSSMLTVQASVGTRQNQVDRAQEANMQKATSLEAQRSGVEDIDIAKSILDLQTQQTTYQAALATTARVLQPTLMDFLS